MKLLYYVGTGSNKFGGLEKFNISLFQLLIRNKIDLVVVYRRPIVDGPFKNFLDKNHIYYQSIFDSFNLAGESKLTNALRLAKIIAKEKPDLIHYNFANLFDITISRWYNLFGKFKSIYTEHCHPDLRDSRVRTVYAGISLFVNKILCVSQAINREFMENLHSKKSQTLYLGVPGNKYKRAKCRKQYGFKDDEIIITNIAYHDRVKGVDVLLRAIAYLKNDLGVSNFRVVQVGGSPYKDTAAGLELLYSEANLGNVFEMWGLRNDVDQILAASDLYCQPSRSEGIPLSLMEAGMAMLPVVATNVGGIPEVARNNENALLCKSEDYKDIAIKIKSLIDSHERRKEMGEKGYKLAYTDFNIERQAEKLLDIYSKTK